MLSPVLLLAAAGFGLLAAHLWTGAGAGTGTARPALAGLVAAHALVALGNGLGVADAVAGWRGVLALAGVQVLLLGPTLYVTWRLDVGVPPIE